MIGHIDHLLAAYVTGQLSPKAAAQVNRHIRRCERCLCRLALYEQTAADLRSALGQSRPLPDSVVRQWWQPVSEALRQPAQRHIPGYLLPAIISLLMFLVPAALGMQHPGNRLSSGTALSETASPVMVTPAATAYVTTGTMTGTAATITPARLAEPTLAVRAPDAP